MCYALTDAEWSIIQPILPTKSRGVPRVDDRRVLNGIFWILRSGAPWRDLLEFQNEVQHPRLDMISGRLEEPEECCSGNIPSFEL
jgi:transposase